MSQRAILVGCNYTGTDSALEGCWNDVQRMFDILCSIYGYSADAIIRMTDDLGATDPRYPTRANILAQFSAAIASLQPGDTLVLHYSGHGTTERTKYSKSILNPGVDDVIVPTDVISASGYHEENEILDTELWTLASQAPAGCMVFAVIDACHSGTVFNLPYQMRLDARSPGGGKQYTIRKVEQNPDTTATVICLAGCKDDQTSLDGVDDKNQPSGALTFAFCSFVLKHARTHVTYNNMLAEVRREIQTQYAGTPNLQEPQLCFGRQADSRTSFTLAGTSTVTTTRDIDRLLGGMKIPSSSPSGIHRALLSHAQKFVA